MSSLGLYGAGAASAEPNLPPEVGKGKHVVVLGAGIAGLATAYSLEQAGFLVTVLEARDRVGGRAWTVRHGDRIEMNGEAPQTCAFAKDVYFNAGPARLPSIHTGMLGYAKKFGIPLEVEINSSRSAYIMAADGTRFRMRTAINDTRGHIAELLAKAIDQNRLDQLATREDLEKLRPFLTAYGDLNAQGRFAGTMRSGFGSRPDAGVGRFAGAPDPVPLARLLANEQLPATLFEESLYMQATMFQPVGGMDRISAGFNRHLRRPALCNAEVEHIRQRAAGIEIVYRDRPSGTVTSVEADYAVCTIPFPVLTRIDADFSRAVAAAIAGVAYDESVKVAFESPRFWEKEEIYGGLSFVGGDTSLVWYPSTGLHSDSGMLLACYCSGERAVRFSNQPIRDQIEASRAVVERLHPGHGIDLSNGLAVNWSKVPYSLGPWPNWFTDGAGRQEGRIDTPAFRLLNRPDNRIYFAGAALSQTPGWQEGGLQSAHYTAAAIAHRAAQEGAAPRRRAAA